MMANIFIRSYSKDYPWLGHCLESIRRFVVGHSKIVLSVPLPEVEEAYNLFSRYGVVMQPWNPEDSRGYLDQQINKLHADLGCQSDLVIHVDSDCVFTGPFTPLDLMKNGKPELLYTPYADLPPEVPWRSPTEAIVKRPVANEYMRRLPLMYPTWLYGEFRKYVENMHGCTLTEYVKKLSGTGFSEFNALGAFAHLVHPHKFVFTNTQTDPFTPLNCKQFWSYGGITTQIEGELLKYTG